MGVKVVEKLLFNLGLMEEYQAKEIISILVLLEKIILSTQDQELETL